MEPERLTLPLAGGRFTAEVLRAGQGGPLLYLHGALGPAGGWAPFLDILAGEFTVHAPWFPGYGNSQGVEHLDDVTDLVLYHLELMDALDVEAAHVVGHFLGGMVAAEMAALDSHYVQKLVLVSAAGLWRDDVPVADFFAMSPHELEQALWADPDGPAARQAAAVGDDDTQALLALERTLGLAAAGKFLWPIPDRGLKRRLYRVKSPALVLWGAEDRIIPPVYATTLAQHLPGAQVDTLAGAGHLLMLEQPDEFARRVVAFIKG